MNWEKAKKSTMKIMLQSFIYYLNEVISEDFSEEELDTIANFTFNVMTNSLYPDTALMWNEEIFRLAEKSNKEQTIKDIYSVIGWEDDSG